MMVFMGYLAFSLALGGACAVAASIYRDWMRDHRTAYGLVWINRPHKEARCRR